MNQRKLRNAEAKTKLEEFEDLVRSGRRHLVRSQLSTIDSKTLSRESTTQFANFARRAGWPELTLKLLRNIVRPESRSTKPAEPSEVAIYAAALAKIGAPLEALTLLSPLIKSQVPEVLLYAAFAHIHLWEYKEAIPLLRKYLKLKEINLYLQTIANLNLAACVRATTTGRSEMKLLLGVQKTAKNQGWPAIELGALELAAQSAIMNNAWDESEKLLLDTLNLSKKNKLNDLIVQKWLAIFELRRPGSGREAISLLMETRNKAIEQGAWEVLRDLDCHRAIEQRDESLFLKVYFGTSSESYRERMKADAPSWTKIPAVYIRRIGPSDHSKEVPQLDLGRLTESPNDQFRLHVLRILTSDAYAPLKMGSLFVHVYPGEFYDPVQSPLRLRSTIARIRKWLRAKEIPLVIEVSRNEVHVKAVAPVDLILHRSYDLFQATNESYLSQLKAAWPYQSFSSAKAAKLLAIKEHRARSLLKWATEHKKIRRTGEKRSTLFRFAK